MLNDNLGALRVILETLTGSVSAAPDELQALRQIAALSWDSRSGSVRLPDERDGSDYRLVAGTLVTTGAAGEGAWELLANATHEPLGIGAITVGTDSLSFALENAADSVVTLLAGPDETLAADGYTVGASVGLSTIVLQMSRAPLMISGYLRWTGSAWSWSPSDDASAATVSASGGIVTLTHASVGATFAASATARLTGPRAVCDGVGSTTTTVAFVDSAGALITSPSTTHRAYVCRSRPGGIVNPQSVLSGNIWVVGVMRQS